MQGRARLLLLALSCSVAALACTKDDPADNQLSAPSPIQKPGVGTGDGTVGGLPDPVTSSSGGGATACTEVTASQFEFLSSDETFATYQAVVTSASGRTGGLTLLFATHDASSEDLSSTINSNYRTCEYCTIADDTKNLFFQKSRHAGRRFLVRPIRRYTAREADGCNVHRIDDRRHHERQHATPGGGCLHVASAAIDVTP